MIEQGQMQSAVTRIEVVLNWFSEFGRPPGTT